MAHRNKLGKTVYPLPELQPVVPAPATATDWAAHKSDAIVIDNGSSTLRAGWAGEADPRLAVDNICARFKDRKTNRPMLLAGSEAYIDATSRSNLRTPFESDIVCNFDVMENMLDYTFLKLGVPTEGVFHPIALSETLCNPSYSRGIMSELLFEVYGVPSVAYGVDSLFSFYSSGAGSAGARSSGLIISSSTASTHIIPQLDGIPHMHRAKKIFWGGSQASEYLLKLMQLKYPTFPGRLTAFQANKLYQDHCYYAVDYAAELADYATPAGLVARNRTASFPFLHSGIAAEKSAEELARAAERRAEAAARLKEQAAKQRAEKAARQEEELVAFTELRDSAEYLTPAAFAEALTAAGFSTAAELNAYVTKIERSVFKAQAGGAPTAAPAAPVFPLLDVPDHTLSEEALKEKRKQRALKAAHDARQRLKAEKAAEAEAAAAAAAADAALRESDFDTWVANVRREHAAALERIRERARTREALTDRKSLAAQNRMKSIATLASDAKPVKRRRGRDADDTFGADDADWLAYRALNNDADSEEEEEEEARLAEIEAKLLAYDPTFTEEDTAAQRALKRHELLNAFLRGLKPDDPTEHYAEDWELSTQIHVNIERIRVPEVLYEPDIAGIDQAGLSEVIEGILAGYTTEEQQKLVGNIFVTGGNTLTPQFDQRLLYSIRPSLPDTIPVNIVRPYDPLLDPWRGMAKWAQTDEFKTAAVTRAEYDEHGPEWFKDHRLGNKYY